MVTESRRKKGLAVAPLHEKPPLDSNSDGSTLHCMMLPLYRGTKTCARMSARDGDGSDAPEPYVGAVLRNLAALLNLVPEIRKGTRINWRPQLCRKPDWGYASGPPASRARVGTIISDGRIREPPGFSAPPSVWRQACGPGPHPGPRLGPAKVSRRATPKSKEQPPLRTNKAAVEF
jgi:hypothetical protein